MTIPRISLFELDANYNGRRFYFRIPLWAGLVTVGLIVWACL